MPVDTKARPLSPKPRAKTTAPAVAVRPDKEKEIQGYGQIAATICIMRGWYADAGAISAHAPLLIHETVALAETNESVARVVDYLCTIGPYTALFAAAIPLALQLGANHGRIDATRTNVAGIVPPDVLEARVRKQIADQQDEIRRQTEDARKAMAEYEAERLATEAEE